MQNQERLDRTRRAMERERLDALVLRLPENVLLLSGFWPMIGASVLVFPLDGRPVCIIPQCYEHEAGQSLWEGIEAVFYPYGVLGAPEPASAVRDIVSRRQWKRVGYEGELTAVAPSWNSAEFLLSNVGLQAGERVDVWPLLQAERGRKTPYEVDNLRRASEISAIGLEAFERTVEVGVSGVELVAEVERAIMTRGAGYRGAVRVRAWAQVAVGPEETAIGYRPNEISTTRRLQDGDAALLELGVVADGYWADRTRVCVAGKPTDEQQRVFETVRKAHDAAVAAIRSGVRAADVDEAARSVIRGAGYGDFFPHITGHGVGFAYHESAPKLAPGSSDVLEEGMLTSVEPGVYFQPVGGFRIEDDVLVTATGPEVLGPFRAEITGAAAP